MNGPSRLVLTAALSLLIMGLLIECDGAVHRATRTAHRRRTQDDEDDLLKHCLSTVLNRTNCSSTNEVDDDIELIIFTAVFNSSEMHVEMNKSLLLAACMNLSSYCESQLLYHPICQLAGYQHLSNAENVKIKLHYSHDGDDSESGDDEGESENEGMNGNTADDEQRRTFCEAVFNISRPNTKAPFLSNVSTVTIVSANSFPTCQLLLEGCFPPCCGKGNVGDTHALFIFDDHCSFNTTYHTNGTNCSRLLVPFHTMLQEAILNATSSSLQLWIGFNTDNDHAFNYTASLENLLCETHHSIPLPGNLTTAISMIDNPCTSVHFVISYSNECYLFPDSVHVWLGYIACNTTVNLSYHELVVNCSVTPFVDLRNLTVYVSQFSPALPHLEIINHSKMEASSNQCSCFANNIEACVTLCTSNQTNYTDSDVLLQCEQLVKLLFGESYNTSAIDTAIRILDYYTGGIESNLTLESAVHIYGYLIPSLNETYTNALFTDNITQEIALITDSLLADQSLWSTVDQRTAADLLGYLELFGSVTVAAIANNSNYVTNNYNYYGNHFSFEITSYFNSGWYTFPSGESVNATSFISIPAYCSTYGECNSYVVSFSAENFHLQLPADSSTYNQTKIVGSTLISSQIFDENGSALHYTSGDIQLTFFTSEQQNGTNYSCVFWDYTLNNNTGGWSTEGLTLVTVDELEHRVVCNSSHLTSFAVLVIVSNSTQFTPEEEKALSIITYIGCVVSSFFLVITIVTLLVCRKQLNKGSLLYIHLNLCIALLLAQVLFISGIQTAVPIRWLCAVVAGLLHYLFLCVFSWMLVEGIMLYLLVVRVFSTAADRWYLFMPLGWVLPLPIVVVTSALGSVREDLCWLSLRNGFIWAFVGPVIAVVIINFVILASTLCELTKSKRRRDKKFTHLLWMNVKSTLILLPLLGLTWVFGLFAIDSNTTVFAWLFTISNSIQGFFIFLFHILRNDKILACLKLSTKTQLSPYKKRILIHSSSSDQSIHSQETIDQQLDNDDISSCHSDYVAADKL